MPVVIARAGDTATTASVERTHYQSGRHEVDIQWLRLMWKKMGCFVWLVDRECVRRKDVRQRHPLVIQCNEGEKNNEQRESVSVHVTREKITDDRKGIDFEESACWGDVADEGSRAPWQVSEAILIG